MKTIRFNKTECGVDFLLKVASGHELKENYTFTDFYNTDYFEILFFKKAKGYLVLNQRRIDVTDNTIVFISPFQKRQWRLDPHHLEFTFLIFQEEFLNEFFADKLFTYRLLYFYQLDYPLSMAVQSEDIQKFCESLSEIASELKKPIYDSDHIIRSLLYYLLLKLNRYYARHNHLPLDKPQNNFAYQFKRLLEVHIKEKRRINDYASLMGISRIALNKAVQGQFSVTATHLLKQRLLFEIKNLLMFSNSTVSEIAYQLNFSEPNHLMRFFKTQTGLTTTEFITDYQNSLLSQRLQSSE
ncbi:transcriptional regulator [Pontibacter ummariensis]|uniref:Transcriptional regulator n=1 Tax=Pontibacter ummariensis TaxID=1610492 RepID=A0A239KT13_9BACT|nr:AraC family transcriptional regulator [Pontibacter ummariensis]PRY05036.1 transcriptional regulator [Pontibacter ummariensis]SNT21507.1 transcriptional regulator [Pontibacter ummariensis]